MQADKRKPLSFLDPPATFQQEDGHLSTVSNAKANQSVYDPTGGSYIESFKLTPGLPKQSPLSIRKEAKLGKENQEKRQRSPVTSRSRLHFESLRPYRPQEPDKSIQMSRQENEELIRTLEASNKNITKKLEEFNRIQKRREASKSPNLLKDVKICDKAVTEQSDQSEELPSPTHDRGIMPLKRLRKSPQVQNKDKNLSSPEISPRPAAIMPKQYTQRKKFQNETAAELAMTHLEERVNRLQKENERLKSDNDKHREALLRVEEERTAERKEWDEKFVKEKEESIKRENQIQQRCNYSTAEIDHLRNLRNQAEKEKSHLENLYKQLLDEKEAIESESNLAVRKMDTALKEVTSLYENEKQNSYKASQEVCLLRKEIDQKNEHLEQLNQDLERMNYERQYCSPDMMRKFKELEEYSEELKEDYENYMLRAQKRIADQAQQINALEGQLNKKSSYDYQDEGSVERLEYERNQYRDEVLRSWNEIKRLQGVVAQRQDELHHYRGRTRQETEESQVRRSHPRRKSVGAYNTPQNYKGRSPHIPPIQTGERGSLQSDELISHLHSHERGPLSARSYGYHH